MGRKPVRPLKIGVHRGGYNPNPPRPDPDFVPPAAGIPFERTTQPGVPTRVHTQGIRHPIRPLEIGVHRGGYNPNPPEPDPNFIPAPGGFPFEPLPDGESPRPHSQNGTHQGPIRPLVLGVHRGGYNPNPRAPDPSFVPAPVPRSPHEVMRKK